MKQLALYEISLTPKSLIVRDSLQQSIKSIASMKIDAHSTLASNV